MGYDIVGQTSAKDYDLYGYDKSVIIHIQCPYQWQSKFRNAIGHEITYYKGRLTKKNYLEFVDVTDKILDMLRNSENVSQFRGNLSNCTLDDLIKDFEDLRSGVIDSRIRYVDIS
jgi:hypothetical protein